MGIEIWTLLALVAVLAVYVLPFLVGRREAMGRARAEDRYSAELRILLTQASPSPDDLACVRSGHVEIFRRRPEVRTMNRPAVRNVRALRTERELSRARRARAEAVGRRRSAASRRAVVAAVLLGLTTGSWVVVLVTTLTWIVGLVPTALLLTSMVMGRRAAVAGARADAAARRRIAQLERELRALTGETPASRSGGNVPEPATHDAVRPGPTVRDGLADAVPEDGPPQAGTDAGQRQGVSLVEVAASGTAQAGTGTGDTVAEDAVAAQDGPRTEDESPEESPADREDGVAAQAPVTPRPTVAGPGTPPQGWHPVRVPAPTYTLAARAPRRAYADPVADQSVVGAVPVPARPQSARPAAASPAEAEFHPIDLDAVLERRRAAGE